ncbi:MAG: serine hydrolase domain-containing protein [Pontiella sp.]
MRIKNTLLGLVAGLSICTCGAQSGAFYEVFASDEYANPRDFSGIAFIARGEKVLFNHSNNPLKERENAAFNRETPFIIGSLSKQITAVLVLREVDEGLLKLDQSISAYLPELKQEWASVVTLRHLLNHTSGIVSLTQPLETVPGEVFAYSNLGYNLLGQIVSVASAESYASLAMQLFQLCGMENSVAVAENQRSPVLLADGFNETDVGTFERVTSQFPDSSIPSGGLISTAEDLSKWNRCLHKGRILSPAMHEEMVKKASVRKHRWGDLGYGFAVQLSNGLDPTEWSHSGYVRGYISTMSYYPDSETSLIVMENISWYPTDMNRVFYYHDRLREELRATWEK